MVRPLRMLIAAAAGISLVGGVLTTTASAVPSGDPPASQAPGAPGALSHFDQARKDCLGTARNTTSKIWYTVANGVLSDVYAPTMDTTNVETMQYIVTDGSTFTDLQTRDTTYTVQSDPTGMVVRGHLDGEERRLPAHHRLLDRPGTRQRHRPHALHAAEAELPRITSCTCGSTPPRRLTAVAGPGNGGADSATVDTSTGHPVPVSFDTEDDDERRQP